MRFFQWTAAVAGLAAVLAAGDVLDDIRPGEWYQAPNSNLSAVRPLPQPPGATGLSAVMSAWSGGAFDTKRDRLIVWGGGHLDYSGNEIYAFDIKTLKWQRVTEPSVDVAGAENSGVYPDGRPRARHTYDYIAYVSAIDQFCTMGGAGLYPSGQLNDPLTRCFDFVKREWEAKSSAPTAFIGSMAAEDPASGLIWSLGGGPDGKFAAWDGRADRWISYGETDWVPYSYTAAIGQSRFVAVGGGKVLMLQLFNPRAPMQELKTTGASGIVAKNNPGFVYDSKANLFVAWNGGKDVFALDLGNAVWTQVPLAPTNTVIPTAAQGNGTFGRFQYIPSRDLFIGVNTVDENVFFFRLPLGMQGSSMGILPGSRRNPSDRLGPPVRFHTGGLLPLFTEPGKGLRVFDFNHRLVRAFTGQESGWHAVAGRGNLSEVELPAGMYVLVPEGR